MGLELPIDSVQRARRLGLADRRASHLAADHAAQALATHQSLDGAASDHLAFAAKLPPDFVGAIDLQVDSPSALDVRQPSKSDLVNFVFQTARAIHLVRFAQETSRALILRPSSSVVHRHSSRTHTANQLPTTGSLQNSAADSFDLLEKID